jgi:16S rRNA (guanine527-N7)-methyltransferase
MMDNLSDIVGRDVPRETFEKLEAYVRLLLEANADQNLIAASTVPVVWQRHILDSAQLVAHAQSGDWTDIGSGAGLPGVVTAVLTREPTVLVEPRRLRADFLSRVCESLSLTNVIVVQGKPHLIQRKFATITARAVASAFEMLRMTLHLSRPGTVWLLPKGRNAQKELDEVRATWQGDFCLEPSRTDDQASILIAKGVRPWGKQ